MKKKKLVIAGSGPAAMCAAIYAARAALEPLVFEGFMSGPVGGQLMTTSMIENFPGFPGGILGPELMDRMRRQALEAGAQILTEDVLALDLKKEPFLVRGSKTELFCDAFIIATGAFAKRLDIPGSRDGEFWQKGVSACAICDGALPLFKNKDLFVVGGGDSAVEEALYLTKYAGKVHIVHWRDTLRASKIMADRALSHPKVEMHWNTEVKQVLGGAVVEAVILENVTDKKQKKHEAGGLFSRLATLLPPNFWKGR